MSTHPPNPSVVLFVSNVQRLAKFYETIAAMQVLVADEDHQVLAVSGLELVVHRLRGGPQPGRSVGGEVKPREDSHFKLCLPVRSIAEARNAAPSLGGFVKDAQHAWSARGFTACDGHDPEGNIIQLRERAG